MILGVDLGQKTTGIAISESQLATPYKTITHKGKEEAVKKISSILDETGADKVVVGFVEGKIKKFFQDFANRLQAEKPACQIVLWDETLTTRQAGDLMIKLGISQKKRGKKEHSVAAAIILQSYLDDNVK
jgi:putative Holliday junction resolvase